MAIKKINNSTIPLLSHFHGAVHIFRLVQPKGVCTHAFPSLFLAPLHDCSHPKESHSLWLCMRQYSSIATEDLTAAVNGQAVSWKLLQDLKSAVYGSTYY